MYWLTCLFGSRPQSVPGKNKRQVRQHPTDCRNRAAGPVKTEQKPPDEKRSYPSPEQRPQMPPMRPTLALSLVIVFLKYR